MRRKEGIATSIDGIPIRFEIVGEGIPELVFVHGGLGRRSQWRYQVDYFSPYCTAVTIDLAGHGDSGTGRKSWTTKAFGQDVSAVVDELGLEQVILVGHSMGGPVILEAASLIPERVIGLVGLDTLQAIDRDRTAEQFEDLIAPFRVDFASAAQMAVRTRFLPTSDDAVLQTVLDDVAVMRPDVGLAELEYLFSNDQQARTREVLKYREAPMIVIASDSRPYDAEAAQRYGIEVVYVSETGHWIMMERPESVNHLVAEAAKNFVSARASDQEP